MEVSSVDKSSYLLKLSKTEKKFVHEIAFANACKPEKVIADLTFSAITNTHAQQKVDGMHRTQGVFWLDEK